MLDLLVALLLLSYYIILFTFIPVTLLVRLVVTLKKPLPEWKRLLVIIDITSLGYFLFSEEKSKLYNTILIIYSVFAFLAFAFGIHMYF